MLIILLLLLKSWMQYKALLLVSSSHWEIIIDVNYSKPPQAQLNTGHRNVAKSEDPELWETCTECRGGFASHLQQKLYGLCFFLKDTSTNPNYLNVLTQDRHALELLLSHWEQDLCRMFIPKTQYCFFWFLPGENICVSLWGLDDFIHD